MHPVNAASDRLKRILEDKRDWVARRMRELPAAELQARVRDCEPTRGFASRIRRQVADGKAALIAEIKYASPSAGRICSATDPARIATGYAENGACALSVLTDKPHFQGDDSYLQQAREVCSLPVLRKDFIIESWQVDESRLLGADCILLIVAVLSDMQLSEFSVQAQELGMDVLVEVHDRRELERGLLLRTPLIGINNRNLHSFRTDLRVTLELLPDLFPDRTVITESGIRSATDIVLMRRHGVHAFLVGEALMRAEDPGLALSRLLAEDAFCGPAAQSRRVP